MVLTARTTWQITTTFILGCLLRFCNRGPGFQVLLDGCITSHGPSIILGCDARAGSWRRVVELYEAGHRRVCFRIIDIHDILLLSAADETLAAVSGAHYM